MARRKKVPTPTTPADWVVSTEFQWNGRHIEPKTQLKINGIRGRMEFVRHVKTPKAEWIDCLELDTKRMRAFRPERIKTVHRKRLTAR